jgi:hypothetical protein
MKYLPYKNHKFSEKRNEFLRTGILWKLSLRISISTLKKTWKEVE